MQTVDKNIGTLTGLRGIAALWVLLYHVRTMGIADPKDRIFTLLDFDITPLFMGWVGVHIFFVLSGFLLFMPFLTQDMQNAPALKGYFRRRVARIFPAYYVQLLLVTPLLSPSVYDVIAHLFLVHNFSYEFSHSINAIYWTLPIEFQFYLLLPVLAIAIRKTNVALFYVVAVALSITYKFIAMHYAIDAIPDYKAWLFGQLPGRIDLFACGMLAAALYVKYKDHIMAWPYRKYLEYTVIVGCVGVIFAMLNFIYRITGAVFWNAHWSVYIWDTGAGIIIAALIFILSLNGAFSRNIFANRFLLYMGTISYGIYLWHYVILQVIIENRFLNNALQHVTPHNIMFVRLSLLLPLTILAAHLSYRYIERPCMTRSKTRV